MDSVKLEKPHAKVLIVTNLSRNVVESHLQTIFGFYGEITKIDLPLFGKCESCLHITAKMSIAANEPNQLVKIEAKRRWSTLTRHPLTKQRRIWMEDSWTAQS